MVCKKFVVENCIHAIVIWMELPSMSAWVLGLIGALKGISLLAISYR
jgi:hypothetical protein